MKHPVLDLCARITGHREHHRLLGEAAAQVADWQETIRQAERNGLAPLVLHHLTAADISIPEEARRSLMI
ncbi:MAG: hypothetical protein IH612_06335, partial [Desulfofustis sp.]|nr:hypothetical protein [Desulfofustis sp.]